MSADLSLERQAEVFSRYLLGVGAPDAARKLYVRAMASDEKPLVPKDEKLLAFAVRHAWTLGFIDGGLVFVNPDSEVRRRLYVMLSILETMPNLADSFLPKKRSVWYIFWLAFVGLRACLRAGVGVILVKALGR